MALTIVEEARPVTAGVDTHAGTHVAAALDSVGGLLGVREFPATAAGYARLLGWLGGFGTVCLVGIEGTGITAPAWPVTSPRQASGSSR
jgi:transposase